MFVSFLLALREGLEAALIIGVVIGTVKKLGRDELRPVIWAGTGAAVLVSIFTGGILYGLDAAFEGQAEEIFEGITMLLAAGILTWVILWMFFQAQNMTKQLEDDVRAAASGRNKRAMFVVAFLAVVREGVELALFLTAASFKADNVRVLLGAGLGLAVVVVLAWGLFSSLMRLNIGTFFRVTSILLIVFAGGLVAHGVHELNEAGLIPGVIENVWNINHILNEKSFFGELMKTLFGYNGNPSLTEVIAYLGYYLLLYGGFKFQENRSRSLIPA